MMKFLYKIKNYNFILLCFLFLLSLFICFSLLKSKGTSAIDSEGYYCNTGDGEPITVFGEKGCVMDPFTLIDATTYYRCQIETIDDEWVTSLKEDDGYSCGAPTPGPDNEMHYFCFKDISKSNNYTVHDIPCMYEASNKKIYNITYDFNGGVSGPMKDTKVHDVPYKISEKEAVMSGYDFLGWSGSDGVYYDPGDIYDKNADLTLTARWIKKDDNTFALTLDGNGGMVIGGTIMLFCDGSTGACIIEDLPIATKDNHTFKGWGREPTCTDGKTDEILLFGDETYYACYVENKPETFVATFNANGGTLSGNSTLSCNTLSGSCEITNLPTVSLSGYTFNGWSEISTCLTGYTDSITLTSNQTFYACLSQTSSSGSSTPEPESVTYIISFDSNGGKLSGRGAVSCVAPVGGSCTIYGKDLPIATREGYTFKGWDDYPTCTTGYGNTAVITISADDKYYACYVKDQVSEVPKDDEKTPTNPKDDETPSNPKDDETLSNPQTGDIIISFVIFFALLAFGYSIYYFSEAKSK